MNRIFISDEDWISAIRNNTSAAASIRNLGLYIAGGTYKQIRQKISEFGLDTSHWLGYASNKGKTRTPLSMDHILTENSSYLGATHKLKLRLIRSGKINDRCYECGITHWQGVKLSLHLDHINGVRSDYRLENLRLLCPNCHSLTDTYCGRNAKRTSKKLLPLNQCLDCGDVISRRSKRCMKCNFALRANEKRNIRKYKIEWPEVDTLMQEVQSTSYLAVARRIGVSDNAIRKHIKNHKR